MCSFFLDGQQFLHSCRFEQAGQSFVGRRPSLIADLPGGVGLGGADVWLLRSLEEDERPGTGMLWEDSIPAPDEPHNSRSAYLV